MQFFFRLLKNVPFQLVLSLIMGMTGIYFMSPSTINVIYTISMLLKDILMTFLPVVICAYLWSSIVSFGNKSLVLITVTFAMIIVANMIALFTAYGASLVVLPSIIDSTIPNFGPDMTQSVQALWTLGSLFTSPLQPMHGMVLGIVLGIITLIVQSSSVNKPQLGQQLFNTSMNARSWATLGITKGFIPFLPVYITGFVLKIAKDGDLNVLMQGYAHTFSLICVLLVAYIIFWYFVGNGFHAKKAFKALKTMAPAGLTGFTTMSSSAAMPITLEATAQNLQNRPFANFFIPATANSHLSGDGISITITAIALLMLSGQAIPDFQTFIIFALQYCLVKFSAAGVPGGGVIVILPVAEKYLGLDATLTPILQTIYMLQDPLLTSANVMGNGAFALMGQKVMKPLLDVQEEQSVKEVLAH